MADRGRVSPARRSPNPKRKPKPNPRKALKATALTVDNVCIALKPLERRAMEDEGLPETLRIPDQIRNKITRNHPNPPDQLREVVSYYLTRCPSPSWRGVIWAVEWMGVHHVADRIRERAEPVRDLTLTPSNMTAVLHTVQDLQILGLFVLDLPYLVYMSIRESSSFTHDDQRREALVNHYLLYHPLASWAHLAGMLHYWEEHTALQEVRKYIRQRTEPNLTLYNLISALEGVAEDEDWEYLALLTNLPESKRAPIIEQFQSYKVCKEETLKEFLKSHPAPSWWVVAEALYFMGVRMNNPAYHTALERVVSMYPTARFHSKQIYDQEMQHGHIPCRNTKAMLVGITGSGKTCVTATTLDEDPPQEHDSTPMMQRPVQTVVIHVDGLKFKRKDPEGIRKVLAAVVKANQLNHPIVFVVDTPQPAARPENGSSSSNPSTSSADNEQVIQHKPQPPIPGQASKATSLLSQDELESIFDCLLQSCSTDDEFVRLISESEATSEGVLEQNFVYFIDSGGQPQFLEVLPVFLKNTSVFIFVMRLCEALDQLPTVGYYKKGCPVGKTHPSARSNEEIFQQVVRTLHSFRSMKSTNKPPKILVVGTHKDLEHECPQPRKEKNKKLNNMLSPDLQEHVVYSKRSLDELIFAMNAKNPGDDDKEVAEEIRRVIMEECAGEPQPIPLRWYLFMQKVQKMAEGLGRKVLKKSECIRIASTVGCDVASCEAALEFFNDLNQLFFFPLILPDMVFVDPMVLIEKITELVLFSYELRGGSPDAGKVKATGGEWKKFRDFGRVTEKFLKAFPIHYHEDVFTTKEFILLLRNLLIFGELCEEEWFMPSLLRCLCKSCLKEHSSSGRQAMAVHFPDSGPQNGIFCSLNSFLPSPANTHPVPWKVACTNEEPICLMRNIAIFHVPDIPGTVTVIDQFKHFEVHVNTCPSLAQELWSHVRAAVFAGLEKASDTIGYVTGKPQPAMLCPAHPEEDHLATVIEKQLMWKCTNDPRKYGDIYTENLHWISRDISPAPGAKAGSKRKSLPDDLSTQPGKGHLSTDDDEMLSPSKRRKPNDDITQASSSSPHTSPLPAALSGARPTISQLYKLEGRGGRSVRVIQTAAPSWRRLAYALNLSSAAVNSIAQSCFHQTEPACENILSRWMTEASTGQPVCWASLLQALRHADLTSLASDLELVLMECIE